MQHCESRNHSTHYDYHASKVLKPWTTRSVMGFLYTDNGIINTLYEGELIGIYIDISNE